MISIDSLYAVSTPLLGLTSAALSIFTFIEPQIPNISGTDISPIGIVVSLIGAFLLGLMRITNSVKSVEDTNKEILITQKTTLETQKTILETQKTTLETQNKLLSTQNELLKLYTDDSKKQDKQLSNQEKLLEIENKNNGLMSKIINTTNKKDTKKSGNSGTNYPISR